MKFIKNEDMLEDTITIEHIVKAKQIENNIVLFQNVGPSFVGVKLTESEKPNAKDDTFCILKYDNINNKFYYRDTVVKRFIEVPYEFWTNQLLYHISTGYKIHYFDN